MLAVSMKPDNTKISIRQLSRKIAEVCTIFPWYRDLLPARDITGLEDLPLMTADILDRYYYSAPVPHAAGVYETSRTSANRRKLISYSARDEQVYLDVKTKRFAEIIAGTQIKKGFIDVGVGHVCSTTGTIFERLGLEYRNIDINLPLEEHIRRLRQFRPGLLYMPPSLIDRVLQRISRPDSIGIQKIVPIGEIVSDNWLKQTAAAFGLQPADIHMSYGSTETGTMAAYSHALGKYIMVEGVYAEGVAPAAIDSSLEPLAAGESILAVTSFNREFFPGLRYVTYDVVRGLDTVRVGGVSRQAFDCIHRRVGTEFKHGEKISMHDIENVVFRHLNKAVVQARIEDNRLTVGILSSGLTDEVLARISSDIQRAIPEIGIMVDSGLLEHIRVERLAAVEGMATGTRKKKVLHHR